MAGIKDTFLGDTPARYPERPGFKDRTTSKEAACAVAPTAAQLRARVLDAIERAGSYGLTADEAASRLGVSVLAVRPRVSELYAEDRIERTGERRRNDSGMHAWVMRAKRKEGTDGEDDVHQG